MKGVVLFLIILSSFGCRKQIIKEGEKHLPKETSKGKGMFACYIDSDTYIFKNQDEVVYNISTGYLALNVFGRSGKEFRLFVYEGIFGEGHYQFSLTGEEYIPTKNSEIYWIADDGINQLEIKALSLDIQRRFIAGTFNFDLTNEQNETKKVRDGRFDLELKIIN